MKFLLAVSLLLSGSAFAASMNWVEVGNDRNTMDDVTLHVEEIATPDSVQNDLNSLVRGTQRNPELVVIEQIINIGQQVWKIIEKNQPVVNIRYNFANALPKGVRGVDELDGFSTMQTRSFRMHGQNGFGGTPYDLTYTLVHRYNGSYQDKGRYLDAVTVLPHKLNVLWGYTVNFNVERVSTANVGSRENPVASILMEMSFKVSTVVKKSEFRGIYEFKGDSANVGQINGQ